VALEPPLPIRVEDQLQGQVGRDRHAVGSGDQRAEAVVADERVQQLAGGDAMETRYVHGGAI
jgi:hypothetical protein